MNTSELDQLREKWKDEKSSRPLKICVCVGSGCIASGSLRTLEKMKQSIQNEKGLEAEVKAVGCMGACNQGPLVQILPDQVIYEKVTPENLSPIVKDHLIWKKPVLNLLLFSEQGGSCVLKALDHPFFHKQKKVVLEKSGFLDPEKIEDYISLGGYTALQKVLTRLIPLQVIEEVKKSGLRGRGGAGYPTGAKWEMVYKSPGATKYVVCNGDEGDPGAFMDRSILESDPHQVLEGMMIAGFALGAKKGFAYIRGERALTSERFNAAILAAKKLGLLGNHILETDFSFDVELRVGAGAFVCGEETALLNSIEGRRGTPHSRPPYPAQLGLWGHPTLINNVETFANIPLIINRGSSVFASVGSAASKGTKVFALSGRILNTGLVEVPIGTPLREVIYDIGGGIPGGKKFKAAQTGGPCGGCIPKEYIDTPLDYETLMNLGSVMGSGGLIVMDETSCMVDVARFFMEFCMDESCGKCVPCRVGTKQMNDLLVKICSGRGELKDLELLEEMAPYVGETSLCGLGQNASNPLLSTLRYFRDEFLAHIIEKRCPACVCKMGLHEKSEART